MPLSRAIAPFVHSTILLRLSRPSRPSPPLNSPTAGPLRLGPPPLTSYTRRPARSCRSNHPTPSSHPARFHLPLQRSPHRKSLAASPITSPRPALVAALPQYRNPTCIRYARLQAWRDRSPHPRPGARVRTRTPRPWWTIGGHMPVN